MKLLLNLILMSKILILNKSFSEAITLNTLNNVVQNDIETLTKQIYEDLRFYSKDADLLKTEEAKKRARSKINAYQRITAEKFASVKHSINKRSTTDFPREMTNRSDDGTKILNGFEPYVSPISIYPRDVGFYYNYKLNKSGFVTVNTNGVHIYLVEENQKVIHLHTINSGNFYKLSVIQLKNLVIIGALQSIDNKKNALVYTFEVDKYKDIKLIQTLEDCTDDVILWIFRNTAHMLLTDGKGEKFNMYTWQESYFDLKTSFEARDCTDVKFDILIDENQFFVAAACKANKPGQSDVYSYLYQCPEIKTCVLYQPFRTYTAMDVKFFKIKVNEKIYDFLIFANNLEKEDNIENFNIYSIIYVRENTTNYFVPFQGLKMNGAYHFLPVKSKTGAFVLLAATKYDGIKAFQYDGLNFVEAQTQYSNEAFSKSIERMRYGTIYNQPIVVIINTDDYKDMVSWFTIKFREGNVISRYHDDMLSWCKENIKHIQSLDIEQNVKTVIEAPKYTDPVLELKEGASFSNVTIENLYITNEESETDIPKSKTEDLDKLEMNLEKHIKELNKVEKQIQTAFRKDGTNHFKGRIYIEELFLNKNNYSFDSVEVENINDVKVSSITNNVLNINKGFTEDISLKFNKVTILNEFKPEIRNDFLQPSGADVVVEGDAILSEIHFEGKLDNITFSKVHILLNKENQRLDSLHVMNTFSAEQLEINRKKNPDIFQTIDMKNSILSNVNNVKAKRVLIGDYINKVNILSLNETVLKKEGNQIITGEYTFDSLHADDINTETISGRNIKDSMILIQDGTYKIDHDVVFLNGLNASAIYVSSNLNNIKVFGDGKLDVLLTNAQETQHIKGIKEFETFETLNPIDLHGKSRKLDELNPIKTIDKEIILNGDYTIDGTVKIINKLQTNDVQSSNSYSIKYLQEHGLNINEALIPVHLNFVQNLNVKRIWLDTINNVEVGSLVTMDGAEGELQVVTALKKFPNDVFIMGSTEVENINSLDVCKLQEEIVQLDTDLRVNQTLKGKYHFENIVAHSIDNVRTIFDGQSWEDVLTTNEDQIIEGTTIMNSHIEANKLRANMINSYKINGYHFSEIINDTVFENIPYIKFDGHKQFHSLSVEALNVSKLIEPQNLHKYNNTAYEFSRDLTFPYNINIEQILFDEKFNDLSNDELVWWFNSEDKKKIIKKDTNFKKINIAGNLKIATINGKSINEIVNNSVKVDEDFHFKRVTIEHSDGVISNSTVKLYGQFESLDINDIFQTHTVDKQSISDEIIFHSNVTVAGEVVFNGLISGFNLTQFCNAPNLLNPYDKKTLHVNGNVIFKNKMEVGSINNHSSNSLKDNTWFKDEPTTLSGIMEFNNLHLKKNIMVHGLVNGKKIELLEKTYLSKTRDQDISAVLEFTNYVEFEKGISAPQARIDGILGSISFNELMSTVLLQDINQVFSNTPYFEDCKILDLSGDYKVNNYYLPNEIMLFDRDNYITGRKIIRDIYTVELRVPQGYERRVHVQNVDLLHLLESAVLKYGNQRLTGKITFTNHATFLHGISSKYPHINNIKFNNETIMLKSTPQNITGVKTFQPDVGSGQPSITFKSMQVNTYLDGTNMTKLLQRQAYKNEDSIFKKKMNFNGSITAYNINVKGLFENVNISEFIKYVVQFSKEDDYLSSYQRLYNATESIRTSLTVQAHYLDYYEVRQIYKKIDFIIPVKFDDSEVTHVACVTKTDATYSIDFQVWDKEIEVFRDDQDIPQIIKNGQLQYLTLVTFKSKEYWYVELENYPTQRYGYIYRMNKKGCCEQIVQELTHTQEGTKSVVSIVLPDENRDCFFFLFGRRGDLYCEDKERTGVDYPVKLELYQVFNYIYNGYQAMSFIIESIPHIFVINKEQQSSVFIWRKEQNKKFGIQQAIYISSPNSIAVTFNKGNYYLAIASGHLQQAKYPGFLDIQKYDSELKEFRTVQKIDINVPIQVEFALLPTDELVLYVLTEDPVKPLVVYEYQGISGFRQKVIASTLPRIMNMRSFNTKSEHFILAENNEQTRVIQAVFKGKKLV